MKLWKQHFAYLKIQATHCTVLCCWCTCRWTAACYCRPAKQRSWDRAAAAPCTAECLLLLLLLLLHRTELEERYTVPTKLQFQKWHRNTESTQKCKLKKVNSIEKHGCRAQTKLEIQALCRTGNRHGNPCPLLALLVDEGGELSALMDELYDARLTGMCSCSPAWQLERAHRSAIIVTRPARIAQTSGERVEWMTCGPGDFFLFLTCCLFAIEGNHNHVN